jgi:hypothetical protein
MIKGGSVGGAKSHFRDAFADDKGNFGGAVPFSAQIVARRLGGGMLLRKVEGGLIAISQPAHALLSGDLADAWGNEAFAAPSAKERFAARLHDIAWLDWETRPEFDPRKKAPRVFADVPVSVHTRLWEEGVEQASSISLLLAILVSQHADSIYERTFDFAKAEPENARLVGIFLDRQRAIRKKLIAKLERDARQAQSVAPDRLAFAKRLIATVDYMSLLICWGVSEAAAVHDAPRRGDATVTLELAPDGAEEIQVWPWPFAQDSLRATIQGRRLPEAMADEAAMRSALAEADHVTLACTLRPRAS